MSRVKVPGPGMRPVASVVTEVPGREACGQLRYDSYKDSCWSFET